MPIHDSGQIAGILAAIEERKSIQRFHQIDFLFKTPQASEGERTRPPAKRVFAGGRRILSERKNANADPRRRIDCENFGCDRGTKAQA
jgi:hypothetical protein